MSNPIIKIPKSEGFNVEFKSSFNISVIETLVAFANSRGGKIFIGIRDDLKVSGVIISQESVQNWINEIKSKTEPSLIPDVEILEIEDKNIVILSISEYPIKPISVQNRFYKRIGNSNHLMNVSEISDEHLKTLNTSWDYYIDPNHNIENISISKIEDFIDKIEKKNDVSIKLSPIDFLTKLELIRDGKLTFGAYLLFCEDYNLITDVQIGRFKSEITIIDSFSVSTDLFSEVNDLISFIKKHLMVEYIITGNPQRIERFDYPLEAIREIVINMIVHRDYRSTSSSIIKIYDDRIEFYNPGKIYGDIKIEDIISGNYISQTRNKLIAKCFKEVGLIEKYGSGIKRVIELCREQGIKEPVFEEKSNGFVVKLYKNIILEKSTEKSTEKIYELIKANPKITTKELMQELSLSQKGIEKNIAKLKKEELIKREGGRKAGYWQVKEKI